MNINFKQCCYKCRTFHKPIIKIRTCGYCGNQQIIKDDWKCECCGAKIKDVTFKGVLKC